MENSNTKRQIPEWLKELKNLSWQVELFISGGLVFALLNLPDKVTEVSIFMQTYYNLGLFYLFFYILNLAIYWLAGGFIINLILRSYWTGLIGLSYLYEGIDYKRIKFSEKFKKGIKKLSKLDEHILTIESLSSIIFSITFLIFFVFISFALFFFYIMLTVELGGVYFVIFMGLSIIYIIDIFTFGLLKRNKHIAYVYYPIYIFFSTITLSFLYKNLYYILITNIKRSYIFIGLFAFLVLNIFTLFANKEITSKSKLEFANNVVTVAKYDNLNITNKSSYFTIQSDIITDGYIKLFIRHYIMNHWIERERRENSSIYNQNSGYGSKADIDEINKTFSIYIDGSYINRIEWNHFIKPIKKTRGYLTYIPTAGLEPGKHTLSIVSKDDEYTKYIKERKGDFLNNDDTDKLFEIVFYTN